MSELDRARERIKAKLEAYELERQKRLEQEKIEREIKRQKQIEAEKKKKQEKEIEDRKQIEIYPTKTFPILLKRGSEFQHKYRFQINRLHSLFEESARTFGRYGLERLYNLSYSITKPRARSFTIYSSKPRILKSEAVLKSRLNPRNIGLSDIYQANKVVLLATQEQEEIKTSYEASYTAEGIKMPYIGNTAENLKPEAYSQHRFNIGYSFDGQMVRLLLGDKYYEKYRVEPSDIDELAEWMVDAIDNNHHYYLYEYKPEKPKPSPGIYRHIDDDHGVFPL